MDTFLLVVETIQAVVLAGSGLTGAVVAVKGLQTWREQIKGRAEYDLARRFHRSVLELRDAIARVRAPYLTAGELDHAAAEFGLDRRDDHQVSRAARAIRWRAVQAAGSALRQEELEAEVLWGRAVASCAERLHTAVREVSRADEEYYDRYRDGPPPREDWENSQRLRREMWGSGSEEDEMWKRIEAGVAEVERVMRPRLKLGEPASEANAHRLRPGGDLE